MFAFFRLWRQRFVSLLFLVFHFSIRINESAKRISVAEASAAQPSLFSCRTKSGTLKQTGVTENEKFVRRKKKPKRKCNKLRKLITPFRLVVTMIFSSLTRHRIRRTTRCRSSGFHIIFYSHKFRSRVFFFPFLSIFFSFFSWRNCWKVWGALAFVYQHHATFECFDESICSSGMDSGVHGRFSAFLPSIFSGTCFVLSMPYLWWLQPGIWMERTEMWPECYAVNAKILVDFHSGNRYKLDVRQWMRVEKKNSKLTLSCCSKWVQWAGGGVQRLWRYWPERRPYRKTKN